MIPSTIISIFTLAGLASSIFSFPTYEVHRKPETKEIKALYMTGYTTGLKSRRNELINIVDNSELNAVVIDIKDASGRVFF